MKHVSYLGSAIVFVAVIMVVGPGLWWVWNAIPILFVALGIWMLLAATAFASFVFVSKGHAMWHIDMHGVKQVARRSSRMEPK